MYLAFQPSVAACSQSRDVACYVCTEVLIGKALNILLLVGYFRRAVLVSAYELSQLNHQVTLLEADSRLGGRIKTHYFSDETYYRWEDNSRKFISLDESAKSNLTLEEISLLHPQIKQYTDDIVHSIWDENNQTGSGSYAYFAPGEREKYQPFLGQPYPINNPRIFFAGEHLAINHASIQGAVQTAVSAVIDLLEHSFF